MDRKVDYRWRAELADHELVSLTTSHGGRAEPGWWDRVRQHSLGWVSAHLDDGALVGFANVAWDGSDHAFLLDPKVRPEYQHQGIATQLVRQATEAARGAGCEWLHVDFDDHLRPFYFKACGFVPTSAGLIHLSRGKRASFPCPCCGHLVFSEPPGSYAICPICFWEDDSSQLRWPDLAGGANKCSLAEAQQNYRQFGAMEERFKAHVRGPAPHEASDPEWRPIDPHRDSFESVSVEPAPWPDDPTVLYWWRSTFWRRS